MKSACIFLFLFGIFVPLISSRHVQFFRKDYTYIEEFDAFYKLHWNLHGVSWNSAFLACAEEGSSLFYPKLKGEWTLVKNLTNDSNVSDTLNTTEIFIGLHDEFGLGEFVTIDGHSTASPLNVEEPTDTTGYVGGNCVLMNINTGVFTLSSCVNEPYSPLPFVCKKVDTESCPTVDRNYKYSKASNKCYKVNRMPKMWEDAMRTCYMEGGILVVIENGEEAEAIRGLLQIGSTYHVGLRKLFSQNTFYTVKGTSIDDIYRREYSNGYVQEEHDCGAVYVDSVLYTTTRNCGERLAFICEMAVTT